MTVLSPLPIQKFFDNNGQPLANGKLFTYKAATSTKLATYIDSTGGTPNTNPIILDYRGECRLWIDPTLAYQYVLAPSTDTDPPANPFWSVDNITAFGTGVNFDNTAIDTGSVNAITVAIPSISAPVAFTRIVVKVANTNTGATTISINGGTAKAVTLHNIAALTGNELQANGIYIFIFDGAQWQLESPALQPPQIRTSAEVSASITPSNFWYLPRPVADITRYGGAPGAGDNTTAMNAAAAVLNAQGGGIIKIPYPGEWRMNWVCLFHNITVEGPGGKGEFDVNCIRPFNLSSPPITFGDGTADRYYCGLINCHVSGTDGIAQTAVHCAPQALLLKGGTLSWRAERCVFYTGIQTVACVPSATNGVTNVVFEECDIRNDNTDSASARSVYLKRLADPGYLTDVKFTNTKVNAVSTFAGAYAAEIDGSVVNISFQVTNCYWDIKGDHGIWLKGSSNIVSHNTQLDQGVSVPPIVFETTDVGTDYTRLVIGHLIADQRQWKNGAATVFNIPSGSVQASFREAISRPFVRVPIQIATSTDNFSTAITIDEDSDTGPLTVNGTDWSVKTAGKGLRVKEGSNAKQGTAVLVAGTLVVANTAVTATSRIFLTSQVDGGTPGFVRVSARVAGTSFTITSSNAADTSTIGYQIFEPA